MSNPKMQTKSLQQSSLSKESIFFSLLGLIFLIAFSSYYVQYPGLSSIYGLEPAHRVLPYASPFLYTRLVHPGWIDTDTLCDILLLFGISLSFLIASGLTQHGSVFLMLTIIYGLLRTLGQVFYSFQWDILLIETGFAVSFCLAPWTSPKLKPGLQGKLNASIGAWPLRYLLFKLMFMSGVVKVQANCPTWQNLTALEYHFATQCLPGPLAWFAHQLPPFLLRFSVAMTILIEIPMAFLLIAPTETIRDFGAKLHILLQIMIILTGNYNFFNTLTIALCLLCLKDKQSKIEKIPHEDDDHRMTDKSRKVTQDWIWNIVQLFMSTLLLLWSFHKMFKIELVEADHPSSLWANLNITMIFTRKECNILIEKCIPISIVVTWVFLSFSILHSISKKYAQKKFKSLFRGIICIFWIGLIAIPSLSLTPNLQSNGFIGSEFFKFLWNKTQKYQVSSGYGLFRRMTGVGIDQTQYLRFQQSQELRMLYGWAGLPPSIVARPEIILEGLAVDSSGASQNAEGKWSEINFKWKPGDVDQSPWQMAPHQPRLDWQMWFAALGNYNQNPWFLSLVVKILKGCPPVLDLLNEPELQRGNLKYSRIRAKLYHYDFTRLDTSWSKKIPGVNVINHNEDTNNFRKFWSRTFKSSYLPEVDVGSFREGVVTEACVAYEFRCTQEEKNTILQSLCKITSQIRQKKLAITFLLCVSTAKILVGFFMRKMSLHAIQNKKTKKE